MTEFGRVILNDANALIAYSLRNQIFELYEIDIASREFICSLHVGIIVVLQDLRGSTVNLQITEINNGKMAKCRAIIKVIVSK